MKLKIYKKAIPLLLTFTLIPTGCTTKEQEETKVTIEQTSPTKENLKIEVYQLNYDIPNTDVIKEITKEENSVIVYEPYTEEIEKIMNEEHNIETQLEIAKEWNQIVLDQIWSLNPEQQVYITSMKETNENTKQYNQMIQTLKSNYPNVTYVNIEQKEPNESIEENYESNKVALKIIKETMIEWKELGITAIEQFDAKETYETIKNEVKEIDKQKILDGMEKANNYITTREWYPKLEQKSNELKDYLEPKVQDAYEKSKPYIDATVDKAKEVGSEVNEYAKQKVKNWLNS